MRLALKGDDMLERIGIRARLAPLPVGLAFFSMPTSRAIGLAQKEGIFGLLLDGPVDPDEVARRTGLQPLGTRMLLETLAGLELLRARKGRYEVASPARRWLDPASPRYMGTYIEHTYSYWPWWGDLERILRDGDSFEIHSLDAEDPSWPVYIRGQYELARLSAGDVARAIKLPAGASSVLDVAGGHGWFAAALCQRHAGLDATVVDLPASAAVGREIIAENGLEERVHHVDGDMFSADLGGPHDCALLFDIIHHLSPEQIVTLLGRIRTALVPGASIVILDMFRDDRGRPRASAGIFRLFFALTSGAGIYSREELAGWLAQAGFGAPRRARVRSIPDQALFQARAL